MIIQAILHNKSLALLISDYNINQNNPNWGKLTDLMKHNYQIAFLQATMNSAIHSGKSETIFPEINIDIIGLMTHHDKNFKLPEFFTVGITDKVYLANKTIVQKYVESLETNTSTEDYLPTFATYLNMENVEISLKPSTLFNHHLFVVGATNSGKSTSALSILDKLIMAKKKTLIIAPTGEYQNSFSSHEVNKLNLGIDTAISPG